MRSTMTDLVNELREMTSAGTADYTLGTITYWSDDDLQGDLDVNRFEVEIGAMDYGYNIDGIIGVDFLMQVGAMIDLANLEIRTNSI